MRLTGGKFMVAKKWKCPSSENIKDHSEVILFVGKQDFSGEIKGSECLKNGGS